MRLRRQVLLAALLVAMSACTSGPPAPVETGSTNQDIQSWRATKDAMFRGPDSPLPADKRASFAGLPYYPIDPSYHVPARLNRDIAGTPTIIELQTSTHQRRRMRRVGTLAFSIGGASYSLISFAEEDDPTIKRLFVPFGDLTNNLDETYRGGRYLELDRTGTGLYDLDFNRAYHPFCVFSSEYDCPVPPRENRLSVAIRAGERLSPQGQ